VRYVFDAGLSIVDIEHWHNGEVTDDSSLESWIDAGLFDPVGRGADEVREVLDFYNSLGIDPADYRGVDPADLMSSVNMRILQPGRRLSGGEVRDLTGMSVASFERLCRSAGYASDGEFTELDVEAFKSFAGGSAVFSEDALNDFSRVLAAAMARVADATTALFRVDVASRIEAAGGREIDYAHKNQEMTGMLEALFTPMRAFFLNQLIGAVRLGDGGRRAVTSTSVTTINVAVGFCDIVGYTQLSASLAPDELAGFITDFEARATALVNDHGGRMVKLIGDAIMFVAVDPTAAVSAARAIIAAFDGATPSAGVAYGEVIAIGGDYYGEVVNLASRISDQALSGELLVDSATVDGSSGHSFHPAGRRQLKGFADPVAVFALQS
jgi:class 3 adenylate cyclase